MIVLKQYRVLKIPTCSGTEVPSSGILKYKGVHAPIATSIFRVKCQMSNI